MYYCTSILKCVRVVVISKHDFLSCAGQHIQLTSPVYNNNQGLTFWSHVTDRSSQVVG